MLTKVTSARRSAREEELASEGWTKQFCASGSRLQETTQLYESMGLDVHLEPARAEDLACSGCQPQQPGATIEGWYLIYTRPRQGAGNAHAKQDDDLW
ncbi:MAG: hypothetical protein HYV04_18060 [Deltaproteobacteria bacterium]|nr:hypothetical protein [Deltaproteobacteria bacterium]